MYYRIKTITLMLSAFAVIGCATTGAAYVDYKKSDAATISGDWANFFNVLLSDSANVHITKVDGIETKAIRSLKLRPGHHKVFVFSNTATTSAGGTIDIYLKANNSYKLISKYGDDFYKIHLYNITHNKEGTLVKTYKLKTIHL